MEIKYDLRIEYQAVNATYLKSLASFPTRQSQRARIIIVLILTVAYVLLAIALNQYMGRGVGTLSVLPVAVAGWLLGVRGGFFAWLIQIPINTLLLNFAGFTGWSVLFEDGRLYSELALLLVGLIVGHLHDINVWSEGEMDRRLQAEAHLRERERFIEHVTQAVPGIVSIYDLVEHHAVYVSGNAGEILGFTAEEFQAMGADVLNLTVHPDDVPHVRSFLKRLEVLRDGESVDTEYRVKHGDGSWRWINSRDGVFSRSSDGTVRQVVAVLTDITERHQLQDLLKQERDLLRALIDNLPNPIFIIDKQNRFLLSNNWNTRLIGAMGHDDVITRTNADFFPPKTATLFDAQNQRIIETGEPLLNFEWEFIGPTGQSIWNLISKLPLKDDHGNIYGVLGIAHDITEHKLAEIERLESEKERVALGKERELADLKTRFINNITHEMRTPLTVMMSSSYLLERHFERLTVERRTELLTAIQEQIAYLETTMTDLLMVIEGETTDIDFFPVETDVPRFCEALVEDIRTANPKRQIDFSFSGQPSTASIDVNLLHYILRNLMGNALRYSQPPSPVNLNVSRTDTSVIFRVQDQGIGIPPADQARIFEPFHRGSNIGAIRGTGVGLWIARDYTQIHGGKITFESKENVGTTFSITIPT